MSFDTIERLAVDAEEQCLIIEARDSNGMKKLLRLPLAAGSSLFQVSVLGMWAHDTPPIRPDGMDLRLYKNDQLEFQFHFGAARLRIRLPKTATADIRESLAHLTGAKTIDTPPSGSQH